VQVPPESEPSDSSSQPASGDEGGDQRQKRERDLMRELDEVTGRRGEGETRAPRSSSRSQRLARQQPNRAEEVLDE
jgi:hypothetical protein